MKNRRVMFLAACMCSVAVSYTHLEDAKKIPICSFIPASRHAFRSSSKAFAVMAMIGIFLASSRSSIRIAFVASSPSMTGIITSMMMTSYSVSYTHLGRFRILEEPLMITGIGVAFAKEDDRGICEQMGQTLEEMRLDGTSLKIIEKYLDDPQKYLEVEKNGSSCSAV